MALTFKPHVCQHRKAVENKVNSSRTATTRELTKSISGQVTPRDAQLVYEVTGASLNEPASLLCDYEDGASITVGDFITFHDQDYVARSIMLWDAVLGSSFAEVLLEKIGNA